MARIKEVRYRRLKSFQDRYENVESELVADVPDPDVWADAPTWEQVYAELQEKVNAKLDAEISKPLEFRKTEELKQLEGYVEERGEALRSLEAEIKAKRRELDRCIELGMRALFEPQESSVKVATTCPECGKSIYLIEAVGEGWSRMCPFCSYRFPKKEKE